MAVRPDDLHVLQSTTLAAAAAAVIAVAPPPTEDIPTTPLTRPKLERTESDIARSVANLPRLDSYVALGSSFSEPSWAARMAGAVEEAIDGIGQAAASTVSWTSELATQAATTLQAVWRGFSQRHDPLLQAAIQRRASERLEQASPPPPPPPPPPPEMTVNPSMFQRRPPPGIRPAPRLMPQEARKLPGRASMPAAAPEPARVSPTGRQSKPADRVSSLQVGHRPRPSPQLHSFLGGDAPQHRASPTRPPLEGVPSPSELDSIDQSVERVRYRVEVLDRMSAREAPQRVRLDW